MVDGGALGGYSPPAAAVAAPKFTAGGRGFLDPNTSPVRGPNFGPIADPSTIKANSGKLSQLLGGGGADRAGAKEQTEKAEAAKRYADAIDDLTFSMSQLSMSEEEAVYQETLRNALATAGTELTTAQTEQITLLVSQMANLSAAQQAIAEADAANAEAGQKWIDLKEGAGDAVASAFERAIIEGESLRETFAGLLQDLAKLIFQKLVFDAISKSISGGFGVGGMAMGGGVNPGNAYTVGESGPELFVPKVPGTIVPNRALGAGGGGVVIHSTVNASGGVNKSEMQTLLNQRDKQLVRMLPGILVDKKRRNALQGAFA